ncbi:hypothetical protein HDV00_010877 [Rhizophlyctis rosea]|nr:hypothetical protein HDV00_010877 [Rhizophlyctis rosea]
MTNNPLIVQWPVDNINWSRPEIRLSPPFYFASTDWRIALAITSNAATNVDCLSADPYALPMILSLIPDDLTKAHAPVCISVFFKTKDGASISFHNMPAPLSFDSRRTLQLGALLDSAHFFAKDLPRNVVVGFVLYDYRTHPYNMIRIPTLPLISTSLHVQAGSTQFPASCSTHGLNANHEHIIIHLRDETINAFHMDGSYLTTLVARPMQEQNSTTIYLDMDYAFLKKLTGFIAANTFQISELLQWAQILLQEAATCSTGEQSCRLMRILLELLPSSHYETCFIICLRNIQRDWERVKSMPEWSRLTELEGFVEFWFHVREMGRKRGPDPVWELEMEEVENRRREKKRSFWVQRWFLEWWGAEEGRMMAECRRDTNFEAGQQSQRRRTGVVPWLSNLKLDTHGLKLGDAIIRNRINVCFQPGVEDYVRREVGLEVVSDGLSVMADRAYDVTPPSWICWNFQRKGRCDCLTFPKMLVHVAGYPEWQVKDMAVIVE